MTDQNRRRIDIVTAPEFVDDLAEADVDELRHRRQLCSGLETELSYYRRMIHGRMDLLAFEMRRRAGEEERTLLEALPEILAHGASRGGGLPERSVVVEVPDLPLVGRRPIDRVLDDDFIARLPTLADDELFDAQQRLAAAEEDVSRERRAVYDVLDAVQVELTRRYRDGLADVADAAES